MIWHFVWDFYLTLYPSVIPPFLTPEIEGDSIALVVATLPFEHPERPERLGLWQQATKKKPFRVYLP